MKQRVVDWIESYLFSPSIFQKIISYSLTPFSLIYSIISLITLLKQKKDFNIPIISIGNLSIGGSGKTPFVIELAKDYPNSSIILRGYGRKSKGLTIVSLFGDIKVDVDISGDEAMLIAKSLPNSTVIVAENREEAIIKAKSLNSDIIFLDDGFRHRFVKFDILLFPKELKNPFPIPSGSLRLPLFVKKFANIIAIEEIDFFRKVYIENITDKMVLVTAISNPKRLDKFLDKYKVIAKEYFLDHHYFSKNELVDILKKYSAESILTTTKDEVKMRNFELELSILKLELQISDTIKESVKNYYLKFRTNHDR